MHYFFLIAYNKSNENKVIVINNKNIDSNKLNSLISRTNKIVKILYYLLISAILFFLIYFLKEVNFFSFIKDVLKTLSPIFIGFIMAFLLNPLVIKLRSKNINNTLSCLIIYLVMFLIIFLFFKIFIPVLYKQVNNFINKLPEILKQINIVFDKLIAKINNPNINFDNFKQNIFSSITSYVEHTTLKMPNHIINITKSLLSVVCMILTGFVVGLYMLIDFDKIYHKIISIIPIKYCKDCQKLFNNIALEVRKTINGTLLVSLMVLVCDTILFTIIGLESPLLFGIICGLTDLIPYIGPYIGGGVASIVGFSMSNKIGISTIIVCFIVQLVENNIFQPIVMSKTTKLHPIIIIIGLLVFGHFFGILGMIISTPILTLLKCIIEYIKENKNVSTKSIKRSKYLNI